MVVHGGEKILPPKPTPPPNRIHKDPITPGMLRAFVWIMAVGLGGAFLWLIFQKNFEEELVVSIQYETVESTDRKVFDKEVGRRLTNGWEIIGFCPQCYTNSKSESYIIYLMAMKLKI